MAATENVDAVARRDYQSQVLLARLQRRHLQDTLSFLAVETAQKCVAAFSAQSVASEDLPALATVALMAKRDELARASIDRWVSQISGPVARDTAILQAMQLYLTAHPARPSDAEMLINRIAETGVAGEQVHLLAAQLLLAFSSDAFDLARIRRWGNEVIRRVNIVAAAPGLGFVRGKLPATYGTLFDVALAESPDSVRMLAQQALATFRRYKNDATVSFSFDPQTITADSLARLFSRARGVPTEKGVPYPALEADYWFPSKPTASDSTATLFVSLEAQDEQTPYFGGFCVVSMIEESDWDTRCAPLYEKIREVVEHYSPRLKIVWVARTHGYAVRSLPITPDQEAKRLKWYVLDYLKLPGTLAVVPQAQIHLPAPDLRYLDKALCSSVGRSSPSNDTSSAACNYLRNSSVFLDRGGEVLYRGDVGPLLDAIMARVLDVSANVGHKGSL